MAYHDITDINLNYVQHRTLKRKLRNHQNQLFERYSKLLMLRVDFSYLLDSDAKIEGDIHSTVADITLLLQRCHDINGLVGYAWVLEHTEQHGYPLHKKEGLHHFENLWEMRFQTVIEETSGRP